MVAFITALRLAPMFVCGPLIGAIGDRYERSQVLLIGLAIVAATSIVLGALAFAERDHALADRARRGRQRRASSPPT